MNTERETLSGNVITIRCHGLHSVMRQVQELPVTGAFAVRPDDDDLGTLLLSFPMEKHHHQRFAALIRKRNAENKARNPHLHPKPPTPPAGGTPGAAKTVELQNTFAVAA